MLELKNAHYDIGLGGKEKKTILEDISFSADVGEVIAVIGPSGCGKSTLLKIVSGIYHHTEGSILWNGQNVVEEKDIEPNDIGYVPQFSVGFENLSVFQNVYYAYQLRNGKVKKEKVEQTVEELIKIVGLEGKEDQPLSVLSGGQRRRLSLALELVSTPRLFLCDEVMTGLDPRSEEEITYLLRDIANKEHCLILSIIHSLSHIFAYDKVLVLYEGNTVFYGNPHDFLDYFQIEHAEAVYTTVASHDKTFWKEMWDKNEPAFNENSHSEFEHEEGSDVKEIETSEKKQPRSEKGELIDPNSGEIVKTSYEFTHNHSSFVKQFIYLLHRRFSIFFKDKVSLALYFALLFGFPFLVALFAWNGIEPMKSLSSKIHDNPLKELLERTDFQIQQIEVGSLISSLVMLQVILLTLMASNNSSREIAVERHILEKEKLSGLSLFSYLGSKVVFLCVLIFFQSAWMQVFVWKISEIPGDFFSQTVMLFLVNCAMTSLCMGISSWMRTQEQASLVSIYLVGFQLPLSGAVLALPKLLEKITQPFISSYWGWSGYLESMKSTEFYDSVISFTKTSLAPKPLAIYMLLFHVAVGLFASYLGIKRNYWK